MENKPIQVTFQSDINDGLYCRKGDKSTKLDSPQYIVSIVNSIEQTSLTVQEIYNLAEQINEKNSTNKNT